MNNTKQSTALSKCMCNRLSASPHQCKECLHMKDCALCEHAEEMGNTSATLPPVQSEEMESKSEKIKNDIIERTMFARKEAWDNNNVWGTHYSADVQFLLSRLTASEARNKELEADKAKLLADCKKMKYWIMTEPCTCKMSSNRPCRACVLNNGFLSAFSYTDSPTAYE